MNRCALVLLACCWATGAQAGPALVPGSDAWVTISTEELRAGYDVLWAVSDVHGRLEEFDRLLLAAHLATRDAQNRLVWDPAQHRQLFVAVGDYIDGGPESAAVVSRLARLSAQAAAAGSRFVVLLGNHEVEFLANPGSANRRLLSSARHDAAELALSRHPTAEELSESGFGRFLRTLPVAAFIGSWLFAHSGHLDSAEDPAALEAYFAGLAASWSRGGTARYQALLPSGSIVESHNWWKRRKQRRAMKERLSALGLNGLVFGHDPDALGFPDRIAMDSDGWFLKLDTGLKTSASEGALLRCEVAPLVQGTRLVMTSGACRALLPTGASQELSR